MEVHTANHDHSHEEQGYSEIEEERDLRLYAAQLKASDGYDVDDFPKLEAKMYGLVIPLSDPNDCDIVRECANIALEEYNKDKPTNYHLREVMKANAATSGGVTFCITFDAYDDNGDSKTFQTKVFYGAPNEDGSPDIEVLRFRIKPESQVAVAS